MKKRSAGSVVIRSNVAFDRRADLVPGDLRYDRLYAPPPNQRQHHERLYYQACCRCHRTAFQIDLNGCAQCAYVRLPDDIDAIRSEYDKRVIRARRRERDENAAIEAARAQPGFGPRFVE